MSGAIGSAVDLVRRAVEQLEGYDAPMDQSRVAPYGAVQLGRTKLYYATKPPGATSFDRAMTTTEAHDEGAAAGKITVDLDTDQPATLNLDFDSPLPKYSFSVAVVEFGQYRVLIPQPCKMLWVLDDAGGGPFPGGRKGFFADLTLPAGTIAGFRDSIPIAFMQTAAAFVAPSFPTKAGNCYCGIQAWPLPGTPLAGVDAVKGFFICHLQAPGDPIAALVKEATYDPAGGAKKFKFEFSRDAQGNLLDVTFTIVAP